jgi:hypothetical protein
MNLKRVRNILILIVLTAAALQSCVPVEGPAQDDSSAVIETAVAATMAAGEEGDPPDTVAPPPSPTWTIHPTVTASPPETNFEYAGVSFFFNALLAENIVAGTNPGQYDEQVMFWSTPQHREFIFNNWVLSGAFHTPAIRVYPVADFIAINENVANVLAALDTVLGTQPLNDADLRVPDLFGAGQLYHSNAKAMRFQNGYGARWLSQYGQAYFPVGWPNQFYTFQGFTDDGLFYVSIILPVNHPSLPATDSVTLDNAFADNYPTYAVEIQSQLEAESDNSFMPSLVLLDQLVTSLLVGTP